MNIKKIFKEVQSIEILNIFGLITNIGEYHIEEVRYISMTEENISQELRLENKDGIRNYFIEEINQNELTSKKYKKDCGVLNYTDRLLILASTITGCILICAFASLVSVFI